MDSITTIGHSRIQHGKDNDRIYLMKLGSSDPSELINELDRLASEKKYGKIFAKIHANKLEPFLANGYREEAHVPHFYEDGEEACFLGKYLKPDRAIEKYPDLVEEVITIAQGKEQTSRTALDEAERGFNVHPIRESDLHHVAEVFKKVFETYPFPIHDPEYLRQTMESHIFYFGAWKGDDLVAVSSAETDMTNKNVEMTDFATLPKWRGKSLALILMNKMEAHMKESGVKTAYTIARSYSHGMNITFARMGYEFTGTLTNNTNICGKIESMNIWHKPLL